MAARPTTQRRTWTPVPAVLLRSTGLPVELLAGLATPGLYERCGRLADLRARVRGQQDEFASRVFPGAVATAEELGADRAEFRAWYRARRQVERGEPVGLPAGLADRHPAVGTWLDGWASLLAMVAAEHATLVSDHTAAVGDALARLVAVVADEGFAEAVFLSSPSMYAALRRYSGRTGDRTVIGRVDLQLYSYLQRFTTKNDTMSRYGPIDHGVVDPDPAAPALTMIIGEGRPARLTRVAYWAADALAATIAADPPVGPYLTPRLADGLILDSPAGTLRNTASGRAIVLTGPDARLLAAVDGHTTVTQLIDRFGADASARLAALVERRRVTTTPRIPTAELDPLAWVHRWVSALPAGCPTRERWLPVVVEQLDIASQFADAPLPTKVTLLEAAERAFTAATGRPARRAEGELYADRTLLFDEAHGDITCRIGPALLDELGRRLAPAMWLCASYSLAVQAVCRRQARAVLAEMGGRAPYLQFADRLRHRVTIDECRAAPEAQEFLAALYRLVAARTEGDQAVLSAADVAGLAGPVPAGTVLSPDIFLAADSVAALHAGDIDVIVGEVHHGVQVWTHLTTFWPDRDGLAGTLADLFGPGDDRQGPVWAAFVHGRRQGKAFPMELPGHGIEFGGRSTKDRSLLLSVGELEVVDDGTQAVLWSARLGRTVRAHAGDPRSIVNWIFGPPPVGAPPPPGAEATPRLRVGGAVLWRRGWTVPAAALDAARAARVPADAQLLTTEVWRARGLPRCGFVRLPEERKPVYCDVGDPLSVAHLLARAAGSTSLRVTELLPDPGQWWLPAAGGGRRSCEWRTTWVCGAGDG